MCFNTPVRRCFLLVSCSLLGVYASAQQPIGELFASDASVRGSVVLVSGGTQVMAGSQLTAGATPALLRLTRGGELRICPGTNVAISASSPDSQLLFGINTGAIEAHYTLASVADSVVTPDFRIQFPGPGRFDFAIGADAQGNTCVRSLEGNASAVVVSEMMGNGIYQVKTGDSIVFKNGKLSEVAPSDEPCGCPAPRAAVVEATHTPDTPLPPPVAPSSQPVSPDTHVEIETPFVFHGDAPAEDATYGVSKLRTRGATQLALKLQPQTAAVASSVATVKPEPAKTQPAKQRGFFSSIGRFFSKMFGRG